MMFIRTMSSIAAASALLTAAPALASEPADANPRTSPRCCERAAAQPRGGRSDASEKQKATAERADEGKAPPRADERPLGWDPSWGG